MLGAFAQCALGFAAFVAAGLALYALAPLAFDSFFNFIDRLPSPWRAIARTAFTLFEAVGMVCWVVFIRSIRADLAL
jgi:hypothetical protein